MDINRNDNISNTNNNHDSQTEEKALPIEEAS